jgi:alginate O-acetyltransferase complex protein AlgI
MSFNSALFPLFFAIVACLYFALPARQRWKLLLAASYLFYMAWKPVYVIWLLAITALDFWCALKMGDRKPGDKARLKWLLLSVGGNLATLFLFKYSGFAADILRAVGNFMNLTLPVPAWHLLLPLGISFHTLQTIGYSVDVYRGNKEPERSLGLFALYVSFFPQMVAGPIERSTHMLPQLHREHDFQYQRVVSGLQLMLWGFFKKLVIADRAGLFVNTVYGAPAEHDGVATAIATWLYAFQIYCDFSGYSDIALGAARVFGIELTVNFDRPYLSRSIPEFWRRWHISLSTWFRDYVYVPLGGSRTSESRWVFNIAVVFLLSGLWHGANWTFLTWGALNGLYLVVARFTEPVSNSVRTALGLDRSQIWRAMECFFTFNLVAFSWILFRARSLADAAQLIRNLAAPHWTQFLADLHRPASLGEKGLLLVIALIAGLVAVEWLTQGRRIEHAWEKQPLGLQWAAAYVLSIGILLLGVVAQNEFLYFQF